MTKKKKSNLKTSVDFLFEVGMLGRTPRSWTYFFDTRDESVAEHTNRTSYIGFVLANLDGTVDVSKVVMMCLFHDLVEVRTSDLNYVHQKYTIADEEKALKDLVAPLSFGSSINEILMEYKERKSLESLLAKDADTLDFLLAVKERLDINHPRAKTWVPSVTKRLKTEIAKKIAKQILKTPSDDWWFSDKEDKWWIERNAKVRKKRL